MNFELSELNACCGLSYQFYDDLTADNKSITLFWGTFCSGCPDKISKLIEMAHDYPDIIFLIINIDNVEKAIKLKNDYGWDCCPINVQHYFLPKYEVRDFLKKQLQVKYIPYFIIRDGAYYLHNTEKSEKVPNGLDFDNIIKYLE